MHAIPTWGYLYRAVIPILVDAGYRGNAPHFTLRAAAHYGYERQFWPPPYLAAKEQSARLAARDNERELELRAAARPPTHRQAAE